MNPDVTLTNTSLLSILLGNGTPGPDRQVRAFSGYPNFLCAGRSTPLEYGVPRQEVARRAFIGRIPRRYAVLVNTGLATRLRPITRRKIATSGGSVRHS